MTMRAPRMHERTRVRMVFASWWLAAASVAPHAQAQTLDALQLTPGPQAEAPAEALGLAVELARDQYQHRQPGADAPADEQLAVDLHHDWKPAAGWTLIWSDRLETVHDLTGVETRNALRELALSRVVGDGFVDAGRVQWRNGVASGFNPTDYLKRGAAIAQTTQNPQTLRENRLGTVMLRAQTFADWGSIQAGVMPDLAERASSSATAPAWDRTNAHRAALLRVAPRFDERTSVDLLAYARAGTSPQTGLNLTHLLGDAWVTYLEWSGGSGGALAGPGEAALSAHWHNTLAAGATWTTPAGVVLTLERQYAGDALTPARWRAWQAALVAGSSAASLAAQLGAMRSARAADQMPLTRDAWFMHAAWDDAFAVRDFDLAAIARLNATDRSRLWQLEAYWHLNDRNSLSLLLGGYDGAPYSEFGSMATRRFAQVAWTAHF